MTLAVGKLIGHVYRVFNHAVCAEMNGGCDRKKKRESIRPHRRDVLRAKVIKKMDETGLWSEELKEEIPRMWDEFSNYVLIDNRYFRDKRWQRAGPKFWEFVSKNVFGGKSIAFVGKIKNDDFRSPDARIVYGLSTWIVFRDNGIVYTWDVERTMFCVGNASERHRVALLHCDGQTVVDMFAGIGYFALPYLVHAGAERVIACEWNPASVEALRRNLAENKMADRCDVLEGDVRLVCPRRVAHRVNLGLIPSCEKYWPVAAEILRSNEGTLHVHGNVASFVHGDFVAQCEQCSRLFGELGVQDELVDFTVTRVDDLCCVERILDREGGATCTVLRQKNKVEWYVWMIHASHRFCEYLSNMYDDSRWTVGPVFLHRVKSYAPHIDHLVVDLYCANSNSVLYP